MAEDFIGRDEHDEFCRRMESENRRLEDENDRQNNRIKILEESSKQVQALASSVEKLAMSVESMAREIELQSGRLGTLENRDGERWRQVTGYLITAVVGAVIGFALRQIGL
ncbi:MAG: hypothetical protein HFH59_09180 [Lachnospiraceae bacterium]|jgi:hypothetical protein|nr:hypothetical protein [Lachnospiraceae bacterium]MCI9357695.1 hypothetical protein [Lachnospiraceae bacterium]